MEKRLRSSLQTSADEFLSAAAKLPLKSSKTLIKNLINSSSSDLTTDLPLSLRNSISQSISKFKSLSDATASPATSPITPPAKRVRRSGRNKKNDDVSEDQIQSVVEKLHVYAYVLRLCVFHPKGVFSDSDLLPAVQELHDNLVLFESDSVLLLEVANLCEEWWKGDFSGKETLISQSLPVILSRSLTLKKKVDVHRVYMLREAFMLFDFEDESIDDLKNLLIRCVIAPLYLNMEDGRKFIAFMFGLSMQLGKEVFAMIKSQIPFGRKSMLEAYAEIVFRAWKAVEGVYKDEIENGFLQGLFECAIYAGSGALAASVRRILGGFVSHRTTEGVEKVIFRLAEPLIFRSLQVMNSNVRQNALHLLIDLFPLQDPDATKEATDTLLEKQFFLLEKLLMDECPDVRVVAVEGCCRSLHLFWEVIPSSTITKIITKIFDNMTHDACTEVRVSSVNGVMYLVGNPQSHEVLKVLLPRLGKLITDSGSVVRAAVVDLLLLLNEIRNFHFHKVVRLDLLFSALANDQPLIAKKITKLLIPSYFPLKVTDAEACNRCVTLIKRSPVAGARFCEFAASEGASLKSLLQLFKVLIALTLSPMKLGDEQIEGLLLSASHLCADLAKDASFQIALKEELSGEKLKTLFAVASTARAQSSVCNIVSTASLDNVGDLFDECMGLITKCSGLSDNTERQDEVRSAHKMILCCGWFDDMFEALVGILQKASLRCRSEFDIVSGKRDVQSAKKRKTKSSMKRSSKSRDGCGKNSCTPEDHKISAGVAWQIKDLLLSVCTRNAMLCSGNLESAYLALKVISEASITHSLHHDVFKSDSVSAYTALALHMSLQNIRVDGCKISAQVKFPIKVLTYSWQEVDEEAIYLVDASVTYFKSTLSLTKDSAFVNKKELLKETISDVTLDHLLLCIHKVFSTYHSKKTGKSFSESPNIAPECSTNTGESHTGAQTNQITISNMVKMLTAVLKFIADANSMNLVAHSQEKSIILATEILKFVIIKLREQSSLLESSEEHLKDIFHCVKSSFTYAAKLLNIVLKTCEAVLPKPRARDLANELFNVMVSVEKFLGYGYAVRFITTIQPWIPDLILALGSHLLLNHSPEENACCDQSDDVTVFSLSSWYYILARLELHDRGSDEETEGVQRENDFSAFKKVMESMSQLLKAENVVLDAAGAMFLAVALKALETMHYDVVLGLVHYVCVKLVRSEEMEWKELKSMSAAVRAMYPNVEKEAENASNNEEERQRLQDIKALLEPVWMSLTHDDDTQ